MNDTTDAGWEIVSRRELYRKIAARTKALREIRQKLYESYNATPNDSYREPAMVVEYADIIAIDQALDS